MDFGRSCSEGFWHHQLHQQLHVSPPRPPKEIATNNRQIIATTRTPQRRRRLPACVAVICLPQRPPRRRHVSLLKITQALFAKLGTGSPTAPFTAGQRREAGAATAGKDHGSLDEGLNYEHFRACALLLLSWTCIMFFFTWCAQGMF